MKPTLLPLVVAAMGALASAGANASSPAHDDASPRRVEAQRSRADDDRDHGMRQLANPAGPGDAAHGWRYFSDAHAGRAVVISPEGAYYYSRGKGLEPLAPAPREN